MFHFKGDNLCVTAASLESMEFPKGTGFDEGKVSVMAFLYNQLVPSNRSIRQSWPSDFMKKCGQLSKFGIFLGLEV